MWANAQRDGRRDKYRWHPLIKRVNETRVSWIPYGTRSSCLGYVLWHNGLLRNISEDKMIGKPARGRKTMSITCDLAEKKNYVAPKRRAEDRKEWQKKIKRAGSHTLASQQITWKKKSHMPYSPSWVSVTSVTELELHILLRCRHKGPIRGHK